MPILTLQQRARELGRIRMGQYVTPQGKKGRPEKLDRFRLTSLSQPLMERVAELYGGTVEPWAPQGGGPSGFECIIEAESLPILVPPQSISQYFELWQAGGCVRRCDGETELMSGGRCVCAVESIDPADRDCKPTTRLNVVLADVEGIGVWRLETHGWYAATELPAVADFLANAGGYVPARLGIEERVVKRNGRDGKPQTRRFMVPKIDVAVSPAALMAGNAPVAAIGTGRQAIAAGPSAATTAAVAANVHEALGHDDQPSAADVERVRKMIASAKTEDQLYSIRDEINAAGLMREARDRQTAIRNEQDAAKAKSDGDPNALWAAILAEVPEEWGTDDAENDFEANMSVSIEAATVEQLAAYLDKLKATKGSG